MPHGPASQGWRPLAERPGVVPGTDFLPSEIQNVSERNFGAYVMLSFGNDEPIFGNVRLDGNIGVRYVDTRLDSEGAFTIPTQTNVGVEPPFAVRCAAVIPPPPAPQVPTVAGRHLQHRRGRLWRSADVRRPARILPNTAVNNYRLLAAEPEPQSRSFRET